MLFRVRVEENNISENPPFGALFGGENPHFCTKTNSSFFKTDSLCDDINRRRRGSEQDLAFFQTFFLLSRRSISDCFNGDESGAQEESMFHPISN